MFGGGADSIKGSIARAESEFLVRRSRTGASERSSRQLFEHLLGPSFHLLEVLSLDSLCVAPAL